MPIIFIWASGFAKSNWVFCKVLIGRAFKFELSINTAVCKDYGMTLFILMIETLHSSNGQLGWAGIGVE